MAIENELTVFSPITWSSVRRSTKHSWANRFLAENKRFIAQHAGDGQYMIGRVTIYGHLDKTAYTKVAWRRASSVARTFCASAIEVNGFCRKAVPAGTRSRTASSQ